MVSENYIQLFGMALLLDDFEDVGKFDRLHHWMYGAAMILGAALIKKALE